MSTHSSDAQSPLLATEHLGPLPLSAQRLTRLMQDPRRDLEEITRTLRLDLALAGQVIGAANMTLAASLEPVTSVEGATRHLGGAAILKMIQRGLQLDQQVSLDAPADSGEALLWKHSILCALATEGFEHFAKTRVLPETFATALLHDLGNLVLARRPQSELISPQLHAELGAQLARHWGLPARICTAIEQHHSPLAAPDAASRRLCSQVLLSEAVAGELGLTLGQEQPVPFSPELAGSLGLSRRGFGGLCAETDARYQSVMHSYAA